MAERLSKLLRDAQANPVASGFMSMELAAFFKQALETAVAEKNWSEAFRLHPQYAVQLLFSGESETALRAFHAFEANSSSMGRPMDHQTRRELNIYRALCHLRIGEQENCLTNHTSESCLMPIRDGGVHKLRRGSQGAIDVLSAHLSTYGEDLSARWLLNFAHMTLGQYPNRVPSPWLIPPRVFASDYDIKRFPEVAGSAGLDVDGLAGGSIVEDFDGDGLLDVMVSSWSLHGQMQFFRNNGDGTFADRTAEAGLTGLVGGLHMMQTDYNNDGFPDVFILRGAWLNKAGHHPNSLLRNNGYGVFEDVTESAGLLSFHPTQTATWFDFNGDGWLDLFIGNESTPGDVHPCELYRNNRDGTFTECAAEAGVAVTQFIKGVTSGDYNRDGRPDLYLSNRSGSNVLLRNDGPAQPNGTGPSAWKFTDVTTNAGVAGPRYSFPTWFWDYDNDGWLDLMVTGYAVQDVGEIAADYMGLPHRAERARLYRNKGDGTFADVTTAANLHKVIHAMGANFGDFDNDGWLDFYVGTGDPDFATLIPNRAFRNAGGKSFQEVTTSGGLGHVQKGHGVSFADLDNDGDQDIYIKMGGAYTADTYRSALFLNPGHDHHWITLKLEGVRANRAAIGSRIRVVVETESGERSIYKTVGTGASFGASPLRQEIGLGRAKSIQRVEIEWPNSATPQVLTDLEMDRFYKIREGQPAVPLHLKTFTLPAAGASTAPAHTHPHPG